MSQVSSSFSQILRMVPRVIFDDAVNKSKVERHGTPGVSGAGTSSAR
jgi:hypothetical protein